MTGLDNLSIYLKDFKGNGNFFYYFCQNKIKNIFMHFFKVLAFNLYFCAKTFLFTQIFITTQSQLQKLILFLVPLFLLIIISKCNVAKILSGIRSK